ncbi:glycosyltransferase [Gillisia sp. M10.2A]|uniref:Glycosyltransferase n=1 Tax=Gillisia lutea TaxID=2909668 RepID=A0ABS9EH41_9FLAO|nr:glycosyltransferase family 2 protein [Gillisia lutea]MCF4102133.1 glycosyltransferase [Gillisia lutea]
MNFSLIVCTYQRSESLLKLLISVQEQSLYPDQILIIDGSEDDKTSKILEGRKFLNLEYFKVGAKHRGLTKQRNYGVCQLAESTEIVCFLDDDIILEKDYFKNLIQTYQLYPNAVGVSGYIINEAEWKRKSKSEVSSKEFYFAGYSRIEGSRFQFRRKFGLAPDCAPGYMPDFSHGYSVGFLPPSGKIYEVEMLMGGIASYKKHLFKTIRFSPYFEGYGLYEDADFSLRASKLGKLYVNTSAQLEHHHDSLGRPNQFKYGKMVVRNGYYVWKVKYPQPGVKAKFKWHATSFLLTLIRFSNFLTGPNRKDALFESFGRCIGLWSLWWNSPSIK